MSRICSLVASLSVALVIAACGQAADEDAECLFTAANAEQSRPIAIREEAPRHDC